MAFISVTDYIENERFDMHDDVAVTLTTSSDGDITATVHELSPEFFEKLKEKGMLEHLDVSTPTLEWAEGLSGGKRMLRIRPDSASLGSEILEEEKLEEVL